MTYLLISSLRSLEITNCLKPLSVFGSPIFLVPLLTDLLISIIGGKLELALKFSKSSRVKHLASLGLNAHSKRILHINLTSYLGILWIIFFIKSMFQYSKSIRSGFVLLVTTIVIQLASLQILRFIFLFGGSTWFCRIADKVLNIFLIVLAFKSLLNSLSVKYLTKPLISCSPIFLISTLLKYGKM